MAVALGITYTVLGMEIRELKTDDVERATRLDLRGAEPMSRGADIGNRPERSTGRLPDGMISRTILVCRAWFLIHLGCDKRQRLYVPTSVP